MKIPKILTSCAAILLTASSSFGAKEARIQVMDRSTVGAGDSLLYTTPNFSMDSNYSANLSTTTLFGASGVPKWDIESKKYGEFMLYGRHTTGSDTTWKLLDRERVDSWLPEAEIEIQTKEGTYSYSQNSSTSTLESRRSRSDWGVNVYVRARGGSDWGAASSTDRSRNFAKYQVLWQERDDARNPIGPETVVKFGTDDYREVRLGSSGADSIASFTCPDIPGVDLEDTNGTIRIRVYMSPVPIDLPGGMELASKSFEVYPQTTEGTFNAVSSKPAGTSGLGNDEYRDSMPTLDFEMENPYVRHAAFARIYKGTFGAPVGSPEYIFPSSLVKGDSVHLAQATTTQSVDSSDILAIVQDPVYNNGNADGTWTVEFMHAVPTAASYATFNTSFNAATDLVPSTIETIKSYTFDIDSTMVIRANLHQSE